ncbi:hypothetical protein SDC9_195797 [bioreactor metagenome]|uniref:Uncharacterized protein n=1 Tax=bioreactor metagenome TaxID=1076179 RepID=A0A645IBI0_9ZZZZ
MGGQCHLHHAFGSLVYLFQQFQVAQHMSGLRDECEAEAILIDQQNRPSEISCFQFKRDIGVRHGTGADHAFFHLAPQGLFQQLYGVFFDLDVLEVMRHPIAFASRIAVYTAVGAAAIEVHPVFRR